jgi:hypothetical protein
MPGRRTKQSWIDQLSPLERLLCAGKKVEAMLDLAIDLVHLHASNQIVCYSPLLSSQIPLSHAGVAFRIFSKALLQRELSSVCTFWDACREDRNSIPTVVELIDDDSVRDAILERKLREATEGRSLSAEDDDAELLEWITKLSDDEAVKSAARRVKLAQEVVQDARSFYDNDVLRAARDFRDRHLAHNLSSDAVQFPELKSKYGDEGKLLLFSQSILDKLDLATRNSSYDWSGTWRIAERNAKALWSGCKLNILE